MYIRFSTQLPLNVGVCDMLVTIREEVLGLGCSAPIVRILHEWGEW